MSSKIKVDTIENVAGSGNVSLGSGHNLVVPGTLSITGASTLTGNVGIGITPDTISNGNALQVNRSVINDDDGGSTHITQNGYYNSAWKYVENGTAEKITFGLGATTFSNATSNSSGADASLTWVNNMVIDANGHITKPKQPAFLAYGVGSSPSSGSVLVFGTEKYDIGGNYNTSNGRFTAPVAGLYVFFLTQIGSNRNTVFRYKTRLNGTNYPQTDAQMRLQPGAAIHDYGTSVILMQMAANDYADIYFTSDDGGVGHGGSSSAHEIFSGYLVG